MEREVPEAGAGPDVATTPEPQYRSWDQVAGYFDGDGNVSLDILNYVLRLGVRFADTWRPQLESVRLFLLSQGLVMGKLGKDENRAGKRRTAFRIYVIEKASVLKLMQKLVGLCVKKKEDLQVALDYLEDRITGDEAVRRFNELSIIGRRRGKIRASNLPYTRSQGLRLHELENARKARAAYAVVVPSNVEEMIRTDHRLQGIGTYSLSKKYGYSESVIRRILRNTTAT